MVLVETARNAAQDLSTFVRSLSKTMDPRNSTKGLFPLVEYGTVDMSITSQMELPLKMLLPLCAVPGLFGTP